MPKLINKNYIDKTHEWLHTKSKNSRNIELQMYYEDSSNIYYILDITSSNLDDSLIIKQVINTFSHGKCYKQWVKRIIIKRNDNLIRVFEKR